MERFTPGQTIVVREMIFGKPYAQYPQQVVQDRGSEIRVLLTPGTDGFSPALWVKSILEQDDRARAELLEAYARREWETAPWTWQHNTRVAILYADRYFAIDPMWNEQGEFMFWYVNFQLPFVRTPDGIDTSDLHLDLIVKPDFSYSWKDEDEYAHAIHLGLVPDEWQKAIEEAREQAIAMVEGREGPFGEDWLVCPRPVPASG